jgi:uncharacterized protein YidB (DUF937 family)
MGLFDKLTGMLGGETGEGSQITAILSWIENQGGIQGILAKFQSEGLGGVVESWISGGANLPVSADQITSVFGSPAIQELAAKLGIDTDAASSMIAEYLPKIVDGVSPDGEAPQSDQLSAGMNLLKGKFLG